MDKRTKKQLVNRHRVYRHRRRCINCGSNNWNFSGYAIDNKHMTISMHYCGICMTQGFKFHDFPNKIAFKDMIHAFKSKLQEVKK